MAERAESTCPADITWTKQGENQWISEEGLILNLYNEADADPVHVWDEEIFNVTTSSFWISEHASEAETILEEMIPGAEINVTNFFRNHGWRIIIPVLGECPKSLKCIIADPYQIEYLHRPAEDWVIDRLLTRAQGFVLDETDPADPRIITHTVFDGPYLPIFEGRFRQDGTTFWFSAHDHDGATSYRTLRREGESLELSTAEIRLETLQKVNDFLSSCVSAAEHSSRQSDFETPRMLYTPHSQPFILNSGS